MDKELKLKYREVRVPSASVKTLVATDFEIVEAPGAGKTHILLSAILTLEFNSVAYTWANTDHGITVGGAAFDSDAEAQAFIEAAARYSAELKVPAGSTPLGENGAINLTASGTGEPAAGNSELLVKVVYATVDLTE